jgi:hypothetical protein
MRRLDLEFQPRRSGPLAWSLLVLASAVVAAWCCCSNAGEQAELEASVQPGAATGPPPGHAAAQEQRCQPRAGRAPGADAQCVAATATPWQQLFAMLEAMPQDDVALLGLTPDARKGQVRIAAEARNLEAMLQYHQRLEASDELSDVSLLNHEVLAAQAEHPVRFTLTATWEIGHARP